MLKLGYECRTGIVQCDGAHANPTEERYSLTSRARSSAERIGCRDALWVVGGNTWSSTERTRNEISVPNISSNDRECKPPNTRVSRRNSSTLSNICLLHPPLPDIVSTPATFHQDPLTFGSYRTTVVAGRERERSSVSTDNEASDAPE